MTNDNVEQFNYSNAENLASELRKRILNQEIPPGTKLKEEQLCREFHISRTPLREAFRMLQSENLVKYERYVGVSVAEISSKFLEDNWEIRALLECYAAKMIVFNATKEEINEFYKLKDIMRNIKKDDIETFDKYDQVFHLSIARLSGNKELESLITKMWDNSLTLRIIAVQNHKRILSACKEHIAVLDAIHQRDAKMASKYMNDHLENSKMDIISTHQFGSKMS